MCNWKEEWHKNMPKQYDKLMNTYGLYYSASIGNITNLIYLSIII